MTESEIIKIIERKVEQIVHEIMSPIQSKLNDEIIKYADSLEIMNRSIDSLDERQRKLSRKVTTGTNHLRISENGMRVMYSNTLDRLDSAIDELKQENNSLKHDTLEHVKEDIKDIRNLSDKFNDKLKDVTIPIDKIVAKAEEKISAQKQQISGIIKDHEYRFVDMINQHIENISRPLIHSFEMRCVAYMQAVEEKIKAMKE
jgi:uncharacterized phage infection (PIP) family protein YhgE